MMRKKSSQQENDRVFSRHLLRDLCTSGGNLSLINLFGTKFLCVSVHS